jgi:hypothetical protein
MKWLNVKFQLEALRKYTCSAWFSILETKEALWQKILWNRILQKKTVEFLENEEALQLSRSWRGKQTQPDKKNVIKT